MVAGVSIHTRGRVFIKVGKYALIVHRYDDVLRRIFRNVEDVGCVELRYASYFLLSVATILGSRMEATCVVYGRL
jgi:hypothetical protein